ncbi:uncharacterized protein LOC9298551, partial [Arabidopsis lyrata subsp. lyrata]|uniref:uncharacterized protein LOC9298551 n=1 Tax=Arabidopsis lyrata subsp. lyrata TaxID=81972 RepID=UPI000A29B3FD
MMIYALKKAFEELETVSEETHMPPLPDSAQAPEVVHAEPPDEIPKSPPSLELVSEETHMPPLPDSSQAPEAVHAEPPGEIPKSLPSLELHVISDQMESPFEDDDVPCNLPQRLFSEGSCPDGLRLNIFSKATVIGKLAEVLKGTQTLKKLLESQFGKLFTLPTQWCVNSTKLIHALFCRQLLTRKRYEMWMLFGGKPLRFSLRELHSISGLCCGPFSSPDLMTACKDLGTSQWDLLFGVGESKTVHVSDILEMLTNPELDEWKKLPLALLVLIDGVVMCNNRELKITAAYVNMTHNVKGFLEYPWGRKSLIQTFRDFGPPLIDRKLPHKANAVARYLQRSNNNFFGFPLPLQFLAFEAIPPLQSYIP